MKTMPPMALYSLSSILKDEAYEVEVADPSRFRRPDFWKGEEDRKAILKDLLPGVDAVGISVNTFNWSVGCEMALLIRKIDSRLPVIFGGVHASYFDRHVLEVSGASYVIRGEGERSFLSLLEAIKRGGSLEEIDGLTYRAKDGKIVSNRDRTLLRSEDLEKLPLPDYSAMPEGTYSVMPFETSRGCIHDCIFCSVPHRRRWRGISAEATLERLEKAFRKYLNRFKTGRGNSKNIYFVDDCFSANRDRASKILAMLEKQDVDFKVVIECRVTDLLDSPIYDHIGKQRVTRVAIGIECGYEEGLRLVGKGLTLGQVSRCLRQIKSRGLEELFYLTFIIGFPWEAEKECLKTLEFAAYLVLEFGVQVNVNWLFLNPSRLWDRREKYGIGCPVSVYDDPRWIFGPEVFKQMHPSIDARVRLKVEKMMEIYDAQGVCLQSP